MQPFGSVVVHLLSVQFVRPPPVMQVRVVQVVCPPACRQLVLVSPVSGCGFAGPSEAGGNGVCAGPGCGAGETCGVADPRCVGVDAGWVCGGNGHQSSMVTWRVGVGSVSVVKSFGGITSGTMPPHEVTRMPRPEAPFG